MNYQWLVGRQICRANSSLASEFLTSLDTTVAEYSLTNLYYHQCLPNQTSKDNLNQYALTNGLSSSPIMCTQSETLERLNHAFQGLRVKTLDSLSREWTVKALQWLDFYLQVLLKPLIKNAARDSDLQTAKTCPRLSSSHSTGSLKMATEQPTATEPSYTAPLIRVSLFILTSNRGSLWW